MRKNMRHQQLRDWWEFQALYRHLAGFSSTFSNHNSCHFDSLSDLSSILLTTTSKHHKISNDNDTNQQLPIYYKITENNRVNKKHRSLSLIPSSYLPLVYKYQNCHPKPETTTLVQRPASDYFNSTDIAKDTRSSNCASINSHSSQQPPLQFINRSKMKQHQPKMHNSRQNQSKRQREWIYLSHYLAISGLNPIYVISGSDDGREPDFTLVFYHDYRLYYVGVELTTLPRLRDRMGDENLIAKRWYWQSLHQMARLREKEREGHSTENLIQSYDRFRLPLQTLYMPKTEFANMPRATSMISQQDVDEVMGKKAHKLDAYHTRRPLQELWLLVHTDKYQPDCILTAPDYQLMHASGFDQVHVTRYPSHKLISVNKK